METIYANIAARTGGNIYIGVVGPVRTGKSTLIKRVMEQLVIPNIPDPYRAERARDELPQSGSGKTIMTSEPKFVPEEAVEISPDGTSMLRVRMIDSVGYMVEGAVGAEEDGQPRMVTTPWFDHEIPMTEAAELGTKKVMQEHCSIGLVVTTDGSITDIPRNDYLNAERRAIEDMCSTGKPFAVIVNSRYPRSEEAAKVARSITEQFGITPMIVDCQSMTQEEITDLLKNILYRFPMSQMQVYLPKWLNALSMDDPIKSGLYEALLVCAQNIHTLEDAQEQVSKLEQLEQIESGTLRCVDLATGCVRCTLTLPEALFYNILSEKTGIDIQDDGQLLSLLTELAGIRQEYEKFSDALSSVKATGYGIVMPTAQELQMQAPEVIRKGGAYGVKLKAGAPSIHMIRVDIDTEISPMVGDEQQSKDLISYLDTEDADKLWKSNIFGKSVYTLVQEGITTKLLRTPEDVRTKFRGCLSRIVNEGATGLICLIL